MKSVIIIFFLFCNILFAQTLLLEENFDYSTGSLKDLSVNWEEAPSGTGSSVQVVDGNLSYNSYPSSNTGKQILLNAPGGTTNGKGVIRSFSLTNSGSIYISFLINVSETTDMDVDTSVGDYFFNTINSGSSYKNLINVRKGSSSSKFSIGYRKTTSQTPSWFDTELDVNTTYLIVVSYTFQTGSDPIKLWINPSLSGPEPAADIEITSGTDYSDINYIQFRQNAKSGDIYIDGIRVSDSWDQAPLPVQLTNFNATLQNENVLLTWETATEINNYGFEIERCNLRDQDTIISSCDLEGYQVIGFVGGHGNSNSPKHYEFIDPTPPLEKLQYRLKQIDLDGTYEYFHHIAEVDASNSITNIMDGEIPAEFYLSQNYPNPFNPRTVISFGLAEEGEVQLIVYNTLGQVVRLILDQSLPAGKYSYSFDAGNLASGIYYYKLIYDKNTSMRKMLLMR